MTLDTMSKALDEWQRSADKIPGDAVGIFVNETIEGVEGGGETFCAMRCACFWFECSKEFKELK